MGLEANATLPAGGWECIQGKAAAELKFERRVEIHKGSWVGLREQRIFQGKRHRMGSGVKIRKQGFY